MVLIRLVTTATARVLDSTAGKLPTDLERFRFGVLGAELVFEF
jgi:hypothetical protein